MSNQHTSSMSRGNGFDSLPPYPEDTAVIHLDLDKGKRTGLFVDRAQLVREFTIAIAETSTLF